MIEAAFHIVGTVFFIFVMVRYNDVSQNLEKIAKHLESSRQDGSGQQSPTPN